MSIFQFRHGAYQLWTPDGYVTVLSPDFVPELKKMPDEKVNFYAGVANVSSCYRQDHANPTFEC